MAIAYGSLYPCWEEVFFFVLNSQLLDSLLIPSVQLEERMRALETTTGHFPPHFQGGV